jgi:type I restriction enzyme, S subunit
MLLAASPSKMKTWMLGDILTPVSREEDVQPEKIYQFLGVRLHGAGSFIREVKPGKESAATKLYQVKQDDFIYSRLYGWQGAFGVIPKEQDGCYVSNEFPIYRVNENLLDAHYLKYWFRQPSVLHKVKMDCSGSTPGTRNRFKERFFEALEIDLPSLPEQQWIVAQLDAVADKLDQAKKLKQSIHQDLNDLILACHFQESLDEAFPLDKYIYLAELRTEIVEEGSYPQVGIKGFGLGLFAKPAIKKTDTAYKHFNKLYENAFVVSQVKGWEGAISICEDVFVGMYVSPEYRTFECIEGKLSPGYLKHLCKTDWFLRELSTLTKGQGARRERLRPEMLLSHQMPMPPYEKQIQLEKVFDSIMSILKQDSLTELESLMPALLHQIFGN